MEQPERGGLQTQNLAALSVEKKREQKIPKRVTVQR